jgi:hypothetical protein
MSILPVSVPSGIVVSARPLGRASPTKAALFEAVVGMSLRLATRPAESGTHSVVILVRPTGASYFSVQCADWPPTRVRTWPVPGGIFRRKARVVCEPLFVGNGVAYRDQVEFGIYAAAMDTKAAEGMISRLPKDATGLPFFVEMLELKDFYPHAVFSSPAVVKVDWDELERAGKGAQAS